MTSGLTNYTPSPPTSSSSTSTAPRLAQHGLDIEFVRDVLRAGEARRNDLQPTQQLRGAGPAPGMHDTDDDIRTPLAAAGVPR
jgi:hypothetical protein